MAGLTADCCCAGADLLAFLAEVADVAVSAARALALLHQLRCDYDAMPSKPAVALPVLGEGCHYVRACGARRPESSGLASWQKRLCVPGDAPSAGVAGGLLLLTTFGAGRYSVDALLRKKAL